MGYENILMHQMMLEDTIRTEAYRDAIAKVVRPGDRVIDFGCGTGILSFFAARSGAAKVYALDQTKIVRLAKVIAEENGFENIEFHHDDAHTFQISENVDVLVSEWMGCFLFHEWMHVPLLNIRNKFLKKGGRMIPNSVSMKMGFVVDKKAIGDCAFFSARPYDIDYSKVGEWPYSNVLLKSMYPEALLPQTADLGTLDMATLTADGLPEVYSGSICFDKTTEVFGLCGWFDADLCDGVQLRTGPFDPVTHWDQLVFPLLPTLCVEAGETVEVGVSPIRRAGDKDTLWRWFITAGGRTVEMDDYTQRDWLKRDLPRGKLP